MTNRPNPFSIIFAALTGLLALALVSCSTVKRGKVVRKGVTASGTVSRPWPTYWVDVRGKNRNDELVTARVELFHVDWKPIETGQWIAPDDFGFPRFIQRVTSFRPEQQRAESGRFGTSVTVAKPKPKARKKRTVAKSNSSTPAPSEGATDEAQRQARFREVREQAVEDEGVRALKKDIHAAANDEAQSKAWTQYRKALHEKMRVIDPSLGDLIEKAEAAPAGR
jgi:hypothetical protein